ncbi:MAG: hypothetical protein AAGG75_03900 [Bacteroidota bacterium]
MRTKYFLIWLLLPFLLPSCSKEEDSLKARLRGNWTVTVLEESRIWPDQPPLWSSTSEFQLKLESEDRGTIDGEVPISWVLTDQDRKLLFMRHDISLEPSSFTFDVIEVNRGNQFLLQQEEVDFPGLEPTITTTVWTLKP